MSPVASMLTDRAAFLAALHDGCEGLVELRALDSHRKAGARQAFVSLDDGAAVETFVAEHVPYRDVYVAIATRADASSGELANCRALGALFVDIDHKVTPEREARDRLDRFPLRPSARVFSGGGRHSYWFLREPLDLRDTAACAEARQLLRRLAVALGGDMAAAEPARVLRLPGTLNRKPQYGEPRPVVLETLEPDRRYNPSELDDVLPPEPDDVREGGAFVLPDRIPAHEPGRNHTLWRYGRSLRAKGWKLPRILGELARVNAERCEPPLSDDELGDIAHNVMTEADRPTFEVRRNGHESDPAPAGARPLIPMTGDLAAMTHAAWAALTAANDPPVLFRRGAVPVRVEHDGTPRTRLLTADRMRHALARASRWERYEQTRKGQRAVETMPPVAVVLDLLATPYPPLPRLERIVTVPVFAPSGRLRLIPGYDQDGGTYFAPPPDLAVPPIPEHPTPAEIGAAARFLLGDLLGEFPFVGLPEAAHALALLLLPFVRELVPGPTPLHLIEASTPGTGKTLLAELGCLPSLGHAPPAMAEGRDDDEWRKRITAKLLASAPVVFLDNVRRPLDAAAVASGVTATLYEDRILGRSETEAVPVRCTWVATGNNPRLSLEMARRTVRIRLDARTEEPWLRTGFQKPDIRAWAREHRGQLIAAALTLGRAWLDAGRPSAPTPTLGMFEDWSRVMGGVLAVAGVEGFLGNLAEFYAGADLEGAELREFLTAWWAAHGTAAVMVVELVTLDALPSRVTEGSKGREDRGRSTRLGKLLSSLRDRHFRLDEECRVRVVHAGVSHSTARWRLMRTT